MDRDEIIKICERSILDEAARLYGTQKMQLKVYPGYEGAANLVYDYEQDNLPMILRISFRSDRKRVQIEAELDFVEYLANGGLQVSRPVPSINGNLVETLQAKNMTFQVVSFTKGAGMRVPDNGYRYREDAPIEEYFHNWGVTLGKMHALAKTYQPAKGIERRPDWFDLHKARQAIENQVPANLSKVQKRIHSTLDEIQSLPRDRESYGLIHGDFNDGNFTVDYANSAITVFDFDDCCSFWFVYELASAWEGGIGRVMFHGLEERLAFMDHYMGTLMAGYNQENVLPVETLDQLPLFIRLMQVEEFLHFVQYLDTPDEEIQAGFRYKIKCIEDEIPYMGFFDPIYNPASPFTLD